MAARIVHFGGDDCRRIPVLEEAGYTVEDCNSLLRLVSALSEENDTDAVLVSEALRDASASEIHTIRKHSAAPVILFQSTSCQCDLSEYDAVIPALTPPESWLERIGQIVQHSEQLHAEARTLWRQAQLLRRESAETRRRTGAAIRATRTTRNAATPGSEPLRPPAHSDDREDEQ